MSNVKKNSLTKYLYYTVLKGQEKQEIEIRYEDENIWMTAEMLDKLYGVNDINKINSLISFLYKTSIYMEKSTMHKYPIYNKENGKTIELDVEHYAPQIILSVGFKIDSEITMQFCKWLIQTSTKYRIRDIKRNYGKNLENLQAKNIEYAKNRALAINLIGNLNPDLKIEYFDKNQVFLDNVDLIYSDNHFESIFKKCNITYEYKDLLQPIFESDRIEFYSKDTKHNLKYNIGIVVYLDTQIVSYLDQIRKGNMKDPNVLLPIYSFFRNTISLNANIEPYLIENMLESKEINGYVRENIYSFYYFYYSFHSNLPERKLKKLCKKITKEQYDNFYTFPVSFYTEENMYFSTYVNLMKIILLQYENISVKEKLIKLLRFYNEEHYISDMPNVILAIHYFERKSNLLFFSKIQKGMRASLKVIKNMAWDLRHYYNIFHSFVEFREDNSIVFPMIFSMDKRFNEIRKLLRINCVLVDREEGVTYPYCNMQKLNQYLSKEEQGIYLNIDTAMERKAKMSSAALRELMLKLEKEIVNLLEK